MLGAEGVVIGVLTKDARVDVEHSRALMDAAAGLPVTFHRAFDHARDLPQALEALMTLGVARVLTSGGAASALEGVATIGALVKRAGGSIVVMAGGSVREEDVQEVVQRSGVEEVHVRGTRVVAGASVVAATPVGGIRFRKALPADERAWEETDERRIREFVRLANG
jgi:copper homeostasis protein